MLRVPSGTPNSESCARRAKCYFSKSSIATIKGMEEKKLNKNLKNCPKSPRFTLSILILSVEQQVGLFCLTDKISVKCNGSYLCENLHCLKDILTSFHIFLFYEKILSGSYSMSLSF